MSAGAKQLRGALALCLLMITWACAPDAGRRDEFTLEAPELEVPADTPRADLEFVPVPDRPSAARAEATLIVEGADPETFQGAWTLTSGFGGRVFVLDYRAREIVAFDAHGGILDRAAVPTGEEAGPWAANAITVAGERIVVSDVARNVLLSWDGELRFLGTVPLPPQSSLEEIEGLQDGTIVGQIVLPLADRITVSRFDLEAQEVTRFGVFDRASVDPASILPRPLVGVDFNGRVYLALNTGYRIVAFSAEGEGAWARDVVGWPRRELSDEVIHRLLPAQFRDRELERTRRAGRAAGANVRDDAGSFQYPRYLPALANMEVDGRGRLWVFPWVEGPDDEGLYPVDVYSPAGDRLLAGRAPIDSWDAAAGDDVYRSEYVAEDRSFRIVRYRLSLPDDADKAPPAPEADTAPGPRPPRP